MEKWKESIKCHFPFKEVVLCSTHTEITQLIDDVSGASYLVKFTSPGVCIQNFDTVATGALGDAKCFDVLSASETKVHYIELKSKISIKDLKEIPMKFYFGHITAKSILAPLPLKNYDPEYSVIFTGENFTTYNANNNVEDLLKQKNENIDKKYINAWKNELFLVDFKNAKKDKTHGKALITALIEPFLNGEIPITKHLYTDQPIQFD